MGDFKPSAANGAEKIASEAGAAPMAGCPFPVPVAPAPRGGAPVPSAEAARAASLLYGFEEREMGARARAERREANNRTASRQIVLGVLAALFGGTFWGFSGAAASFLFTNYHVETTWLMSMRLLGSGGLFMVYILLFARDGLKKLLRRPRHLLTLAGFALFGMITNQLFYLLAVRMTNPGTATVMQCLQIVIIMVYSCVTSRRMPRRREIIGTGLAFLGTLLIATGGDSTTLSIPPMGLAMGLLCAIGGACICIIPAKILPEYGSMTVTGLAMFGAGIGMSAVVRPWQNMPVMDGTGWFALALLTVVGSFLAYSLYMQGVKEIGSVRASLIGTVEPLSATVSSVIVLGTVFMPTDLIGFALIIAMVFLTV